MFPSNAVEWYFYNIRHPDEVRNKKIVTRYTGSVAFHYNTERKLELLVVVTVCELRPT